MPRGRLVSALGVLVLAALIVSGIEPYDRTTWLLEVGPVLIAAPVLIATCRRFPLTSLLYVLISLHALVLILGGAYSYARVGHAVGHVSRADRRRRFALGAVPASRPATR
jgi:putative membrane protein